MASYIYQNSYLLQIMIIMNNLYPDTLQYRFAVIWTHSDTGSLSSSLTVSSILIVILTQSRLTVSFIFTVIQTHSLSDFLSSSLAVIQRDLLYPSNSPLILTHWCPESLSSRLNAILTHGYPDSL